MDRLFDTDLLITLRIDCQTIVGGIIYLLTYTDGLSYHQI